MKKIARWSNLPFKRADDLQIRIWLSDVECDQAQEAGLPGYDWPVTAENIIKAIRRKMSPTPYFRLGTFRGAFDCLRHTLNRMGDHHEDTITFLGDRVDIAPWNNADEYYWGGIGGPSGEPHLPLLLALACVLYYPDAEWGDQNVFSWWDTTHKNTASSHKHTRVDE